MGKLVEITFDIQDEPKHYTQGDIVRGTAHLKVPAVPAKKSSKSADVPFDKITIDFEGVSTNSWIQPGSGHNIADVRLWSVHTFLRLEGPDLSRFAPSDNILRAGQTYDFDFLFRIPEQLPETSCRPDETSEKLRNCHLQLPPTIGNPKAAGMGHFINSLPDMASPFSWIRYRISAQVLKGEGVPWDSKGDREIRVVPEMAEEPPITFDHREPEYRLRDEVKLTRAMQKIGRLAMEAHQPKSWRLPAPNANLDEEHQITTTTEVMLRFDPKSANAQPPQLEKMKSRLEIINFVSAGARKDFPSKKKAETTPFKLSIWDENVELSDRQIKNVTWVRHEPGTADGDVLSRHRSAGTTNPSWCPAPTKKFLPSLPFYTARILVPLALPKEKVWVPSFHSSMTSRVYVAHLRITMPWRVLSPHLRVPVQVSATRTLNQPPLTTTFGATMDEWLGAEVSGNVPDRVDDIDREAMAARLREQASLPRYTPREYTGPPIPEYRPSPSPPGERSPITERIDGQVENPEQQQPQVSTQMPEGASLQARQQWDLPPGYQGLGPSPAYGVVH